MSNQEVSIGAENSNPVWTWREWALFGSALLATGLSGVEDVPVLVKPFLELYGQAVGSVIIIRGIYLGNERAKARTERILLGSEPIKRQGEQVLLLGGEGSPALEETFKTNPDGMIPVFNSRKGAERLLDWVKTKLGKRDKLKSFWANLHLESGGTTVIDTPGLETIQLTRENLVHTSDGDKLVVVSFGDQGGSTIKLEGGHGVNEEESLVLLSRLIKQSRDKKLISDPSAAVTIRLASMYNLPFDQEPNSNNTTRSKLERRVRNDELFSGGRIIIDSWAVVMRALQQTLKISPGNNELSQIGLVIESDSIPIENFPFEAVFGIRSLGNGKNDQMSVLTRDFLEHKSNNNPHVVFIYLEKNDVLTLARVKVKKDANIMSESFEPIYIFQTSKAADMARDAGAKNVICIAELHREVIETIVSSLKSGSLVDKEAEKLRPQGENIIVSLQNWLDEKYMHVEINQAIDEPRRRASLKRLDREEKQEFKKKPRN